MDIAFREVTPDEHLLDGCLKGSSGVWLRMFLENWDTLHTLGAEVQIGIESTTRKQSTALRDYKGNGII